jgi:hypothetical protein
MVFEVQFEKVASVDEFVAKHYPKKKRIMWNDLGEPRQGVLISIFKDKNEWHIVVPITYYYDEEGCKCIADEPEFHRILMFPYDPEIWALIEKQKAKIDRAHRQVYKIFLKAKYIR